MLLTSNHIPRNLSIVFPADIVLMAFSVSGSHGASPSAAGYTATISVKAEPGPSSQSVDLIVHVPDRYGRAVRHDTVCGAYRTLSDYNFDAWFRRPKLTEASRLTITDRIEFAAVPVNFHAAAPGAYTYSRPRSILEDKP